MLRRLALATLVLAVWSLPLASLVAQTSVDIPTFHGDRERTGWNANEVLLTPTNVRSAAFGPLWDSPPLDSAVIGGTTYPPHLYASPLYVDRLTLSAPPYSGLTFSVVVAATSNGWVYAVNAFAEHAVPAGTILWRTQLGSPSVVPSLDGGMPLGILSTPVLDLSAVPPRLYTASDDATAGWEVFAIDLTTGTVMAGWPLPINNTVLAGVNQNGPATFQPPAAMSQRGALNLSHDNAILYVPFGAYGDGGAGWMVVIDTVNVRVASAFAGAPSNVAAANGGMWASGGAAVDARGNVYVTTGNSPTGSGDTLHTWGQTLLVWHPLLPLTLAGTYTPWNYCQMDTADIDLAGGAPAVLPDLDPATTSTPHLVTFGGKQGNVYVVDRDFLPGRLDRRQPCSTDSTTDLSLLPPGPQPQFNARGPLNVFGPYSDTLGNTDHAKARTTPAYFKAADGTNFLFVSGSSKQSASSTTTVPPSLARLKVVTAPGAPAYLAVDQYENTQAFLTPGSPVVTSNGSSNAIVWILVANVTRSQSLVGGGVPHPILYAFDAATLQGLFMSDSSRLNVGGKYNTPAIARGVAFVGTDRIQAFGLRSNVPPAVSITSPANNASFSGPATITITASASDVDDSVSKVDFYQGTTLLGTSSTAPYRLQWSNVSAGSYVLTATATDSRGAATTSAPVNVVVTAAHVIGINAGGAAAGSYVADVDFSGGTVSRGTTHPIGLGAVTNPAPMAVYQSGRYGNFNYVIPNLSAGRAYTVRLHFAEYVYSASGKRTFNVAINGARVLSNFDIFAAAGGQFLAIAQSFSVTADSGGKVTITFTKIVDNAIVQGIEVM